ncbi:uncharacterized protein MONBRDRAFT_12086 [Monosiga brevicollis MX1]|uniref:EGF-like domain-containing protein n=1 Tax=Monosiga brevicollis TaxID=81824 RepID=A9VB64_MONBE|nr:uncharacterized protein MONBRDRAFT_12086 [Monosiga brevicollis MX1]EDQ85183.1 predicted protein [Monosiga brevicollis MX1]|eukprot:XP_001750008.1 hypothetical protein [Monosiga brevicollis MX1]
MLRHIAIVALAALLTVPTIASQSFDNDVLEAVKDYLLPRCTTHGVSVIDNVTKTKTCLCDSGYEGPACDIYVGDIECSQTSDVPLFVAALEGVTTLRGDLIMKRYCIVAEAIIAANQLTTIDGSAFIYDQEYLEQFTGDWPENHWQTVTGCVAMAYIPRIQLVGRTVFSELTSIGSCPLSKVQNFLTPNYVEDFVNRSTAPRISMMLVSFGRSLYECFEGCDDITLFSHLRTMPGAFLLDLPARYLNDVLVEHLGGLYIRGSPALKGLGMPHLSSIGEHGLFLRGTGFETLDDFAGVQTVTLGFVEIMDNEDLRNVLAFNPTIIERTGTVGTSVEFQLVCQNGYHSGFPETQCTCASPEYSGELCDTITGDFFCTDFAQAETLNQTLANVRHVIGDIHLTDTCLETSYLHLPYLTSIEGSLFVNSFGMPIVEPGFPSLKSVSTVHIESVPATSIDWLPKLETVGSLSIQNNDQLTNFSGLAALTTIDGALEIIVCPVLTSFAGLDNVARIGSLAIASSDLLTNFSALNGAEPVLLLGQNFAPALSIDACADCEALWSHLVETVEIADGASVSVPWSSCGGFGTVPAGSLSCACNPGYTDYMCTGYDGDDLICNVSTATDVKAMLAGVTHLYSPLVLLEYCGDGFSSGLLDTVTYAAALYFDESTNYQGQIPAGLGYVSIFDTLFSDMSLFGAVTHIDSLEIDSNEYMTTLDGLESLETAGQLVVYNNPTLTNVDALGSLLSVTGDLIIVNNDVDVNAIVFDVNAISTNTTLVTG